MKLIYIFILAIIVGLILLARCRIIEDGQTGVRKTIGHISDYQNPAGLYLTIPGIYTLEKWNTKVQEIKETASVPSSEGLISTLDVSLIYRISPDKASLVRKAWGTDYVSQILEPYFRETIRLVVSGYPVKALYSEEGRSTIGKTMKEHIVSKVGEKIEIIDVLLRDIKLPKVFSDSIESKMQAEQQALQKEFELQKATKDAEIDVARAKGVASANTIIAASISENYIRWLWVNNLKGSEFQVIYIPTEANIPIMEASRISKLNIK